MTPTRFAAVITAAGILTTAKILCFVFEAAAHRVFVPANFASLVTIATLVSWGGTYTCLILSRIDQRADEHRSHVNEHATNNLDRILRRIDEAVEEAGDRRSIQTAVDTLRQSENWPVEPRRRPTLV
jgi:hypothetical protein